MHINKYQLRFPSNKLVMGLLVLIATLLSGCGAGGGAADNKTGVLAPSAIAISPSAPSSVAIGLTTNFTAQATYADNSKADITSQVTWSTADATVATIDNTGKATGHKIGSSTTVTATLSGVSSLPVTLNVNSKVISSIIISTVTASVPKGRTTDFIATASYSDGSSGSVTGSVTWSSSNAPVAILNSSGTASTLAVGTANITASIAVGSAVVTSNVVQLSVTAPVLASISISPTPASITVLGTKQFSASGLLTDGTPATIGPLTWASSNPEIASIGNTGVALGKSANSCTIIANSGSITSNAASLTVKPGYLRGGAVQGSSLTLSTTVSTLAGTGTCDAVDGIGSSASFFGPYAVTTDGANLYVADTESNKIRKVVIATGVVTTLAGSGLAGAFDATGSAASFNRPMGITTDGNYLYVTEYQNNTIRKIEISSGVVTTLAGSVSWGSIDGNGTAAKFRSPIGITTDGNNLYVADTGNHKIRKIVILTSEVSTFAGSGTPDMVNAIGTAAAFYYPTGVTTDGTKLYVTDSANRVIRKIIIATRDVSTFVGSGISTAGSVDGIGFDASFDYPAGITFDGSNLYVTEVFYNQIRKIEIASETVTTLAGTSGPGAVDAIGTAASFKRPMGITTDGSNLFIGDYDNCKIRKIQ